MILFLSSFLTIKAQNNGIKFENDIQWNSILKKAKEENKYIFLYSFTSWCEPCIYMSKRIFPNEKVGDLMGEMIPKEINAFSSVYMISGPKSDNNVTMVNLGFQNQLEN